jgi:hypothetical protein
VLLVYWGLSSFGILASAPQRLQQVMIGLVILINVVIVIVWAMGMLGITSGHMLEGPYNRR